MLTTESRWEEAREYLLDLRDRLATEERKRSCSSTETRDGPGTGGNGRVGGPEGGGPGGFGMWDGGAGKASRRIRCEGRMGVVVVVVVEVEVDIVPSFWDVSTGMVGLGMEIRVYNN
jgi:L-aminopeptidase/D-esterase-like protein